MEPNTAGCAPSTSSILTPLSPDRSSQDAVASADRRTWSARKLCALTDGIRMRLSRSLRILSNSDSITAWTACGLSAVGKARPSVRVYPGSTRRAPYIRPLKHPHACTIRKYPTAINGAVTYGVVDILGDDYLGHRCNVASISLNIWLRRYHSARLSRHPEPGAQPRARSARQI
jgi:hypothetical protein